MADQWVAVTNIKFSDGKTVKHFQAGLPVAGLPEEDMQQLIENGSIARESEITFAKSHIPGGVSNTFDLGMIPDTKAGKALRKALDDLKAEQEEATADTEVNVPPQKAAELSKLAAAEEEEAAKDSETVDTAADGGKKAEGTGTSTPKPEANKK